MARPIYLDYMATTPVDRRVLEKMLLTLDVSGHFGNPASTTHIYGLEALDLVENARMNVAKTINAHEKEIVFTSGATESNNLALKGAAHFYQRKGRHIITTQIEHKSVLDAAHHLSEQGYDITYLKPDAKGMIHPEQLNEAIREDTILVSVMQVNNEIGVIQDIQAISAITNKKGIIFHVDAAQSLGKLEIDVRNLGVDLMSFSAHKIYGPKGIGALYVRRKPRVRLLPLIHGGGHEFGLRSGTLATHQIVGLGEACTIAKTELMSEQQRIKRLREKLWHGIKTVGDVFLNGHEQARVAGNLNVSFKYVEGEALLLALRDIAVSTGAACNSATIEPSYVLRAIGCSNELASSTIRFSIGRFTTENEIDTTIAVVKKAVTHLRAISPLGVS